MKPAKKETDPRLAAAAEVVRLYRASTFQDVPEESANQVFDDFENALETLSKVWGDSPYPS
ncbi:MAG: hypothetical protein P4L36_14755 [Holophaga sp.]|nr:hypothetical protein [Holophaga sp.]